MGSFTLDAGQTALLQTLKLAATTLALVAFVAWLYRATSNLEPLGARGLRFGPGWAVAGFLVPLVNLYRPVQVVRETWKASDPWIGLTDGYSWKEVPAPPLVWAWWVAVLLAAVGQPELVDGIWRGVLPLPPWAELAGALLTLVALALTLALVQQIDIRQAERHYRRTRLNLYLERPARR